MNKSYSKVSLEQLDYIRDLLKAQLKKLSVGTGYTYAIRTFYIGPRNNKARTTNKAQAKYAKIGVYKVRKMTYRSGNPYTIRDLQHYV